MKKPSRLRLFTALVLTLACIRETNAEQEDDDSGIVGPVLSILIVSQALYFGAAASLRSSHTRWRHHSPERRITSLYFMLVVLAIVQAVVFISTGSHSKWNNALMTATPLPIIPAMTAFMLYPLQADKMREKYRATVAQWDTTPGHRIPLMLLLNTRWKWTVYLLVSAMTFGMAVYAVVETSNLYPILSSASLLVLTSVLGGGIPLSDSIEQLQRRCTGGCHPDVVIVAITGFSPTTSVIVVTFDEKERILQVERRQTLLAHTEFDDKLHVLKDAFGKKFDGTRDEDVEQFLADAKEVMDMAREVSTWFKLSEEFVSKETREWIREQFADKRVYTGYNTSLYCWTRAILEGAIRSCCSTHSSLYDRDENINIKTVGGLFGYLTGEKQPDFEIMDYQGKVFDKHQVAKMMSVVKDCRGAFAVGALLLDRMAKSRDSRVGQLITLGRGYDITFVANQRTGQSRCYYHSRERNLDDSRLDETHADTSALNRIKQICREPLAVSQDAMYERISNMFVPMNWTSFYIHRQHTFFNLMLYMAVAVVFVVFGESQKQP